MACKFIIKKVRSGVPVLTNYIACPSDAVNAYIHPSDCPVSSVVNSVQVTTYYMTPYSTYVDLPDTEYSLSDFYYGHVIKYLPELNRSLSGDRILTDENFKAVLSYKLDRFSYDPLDPSEGVNFFKDGDDPAIKKLFTISNETQESYTDFVTTEIANEGVKKFWITSYLISEPGYYSVKASIYNTTSSTPEEPVGYILLQDFLIFNGPAPI